MDRNSISRIMPTKGRSWPTKPKPNPNRGRKRGYSKYIGIDK